MHSSNAAFQARVEAAEEEAQHWEELAPPHDESYPTLSLLNHLGKYYCALTKLLRPSNTHAPLPNIDALKNQFTFNCPLQISEKSFDALTEKFTALNNPHRQEAKRFFLELNAILEKITLEINKTEILCNLPPGYLRELLNFDALVIKFRESAESLGVLLPGAQPPYWQSLDKQQVALKKELEHEKNQLNLEGKIVEYKNLLGQLEYQSLDCIPKAHLQRLRRLVVDNDMQLPDDDREEILKTLNTQIKNAHQADSTSFIGSFLSIPFVIINTVIEEVSNEFVETPRHSAINAMKKRSEELKKEASARNARINLTQQRIDEMKHYLDEKRTTTIAILDEAHLRLDEEKDANERIARTLRMDHHALYPATLHVPDSIPFPLKDRLLDDLHIKINELKAERKSSANQIQLLSQLKNFVYHCRNTANLFKVWEAAAKTEPLIANHFQDHHKAISEFNPLSKLQWQFRRNV